MKWGVQMAGQAELWPGWETARVIGRGSFGTVYEIRRDVFGQPEYAALKVISIPQNPGEIEEMYSSGYDARSITDTFKSHLRTIVGEYSLMRKMNGSSHIVSCDDVRCLQHADGIGWDIYIKMELLTPLAKALPDTVSEHTVIQLARDLCAALVLCKKHDILHRDIKPQNIFLSPNGDYKLGDFGIAKTVERTAGGTRIGTYKYMAPEVFHNQPYGSAADIYSLGLVLYWLLNRRRMPFMPLPPAAMTAAADEQAHVRRLSGEPIPAPVDGSDGLKRIVLKACAYSPEQRYASAAEMLEDLNQLRITDISIGGTAPRFHEEHRDLTLHSEETATVVLDYGQKTARMPAAQTVTLPTPPVEMPQPEEREMQREEYPEDTPEAEDKVEKALKIVLGVLAAITLIAALCLVFLLDAETKNAQQKQAVSFSDVNDIRVDTLDEEGLCLIWTNGEHLPENGWVLQVDLDGVPYIRLELPKEANSAYVPFIPECHYRFNLYAAGYEDLVDVITKEAGVASDFSDYTVTRENLAFYMCRTPAVADWNKNVISTSDFTDIFRAGENASFLAHINKAYAASDNEILITYAIRNSEGKVVRHATECAKWSELWDDGYGTFDLPALPDKPGEYEVTVYFNYEIAHRKQFKVQ